MVGAAQFTVFCCLFGQNLRNGSKLLGASWHKRRFSTNVEGRTVGLPWRTASCHYFVSCLGCNAVSTGSKEVVEAPLMFNLMVAIMRQPWRDLSTAHLPSAEIRSHRQPMDPASVTPPWSGCSGCCICIGPGARDPVQAKAARPLLAR